MLDKLKEILLGVFGGPKAKQKKKRLASKSASMKRKVTKKSSGRSKTLPSKSTSPKKTPKKKTATPRKKAITKKKVVPKKRIATASSIAKKGTKKKAVSKKKVTSKKTINKKDAEKIVQKVFKKPLKKVSPSRPLKHKEGIEGVLIGEITHFFARISVVVLKITNGKIETGDTILVKGKKTDFKQKVKSLQVESIDVKSAKKGQLVGLQVQKNVNVGDQIYKI